MNLIALACGVLAALAVAWRFHPRLEGSAWGYPALLATFPAYYWLFALAGGDPGALPREIAAGLGFLAVALLAARWRSTLTLGLLAVAYAGHAAYDVLHDHWVSNAGTPVWWPEFCGSVDLLLAAWVAWLALRSRRAAG